MTAPAVGNMPFAGHRTCAEWAFPVARTVLIDLRNAPSSMEQQAAEWARKARAA